jgi:hypothetical protein
MAKFYYGCAFRHIMFIAEKQSKYLHAFRYVIFELGNYYYLTM